jgi:membrane protease YdiL (CAAX protease family)
VFDPEPEPQPVRVTAPPILLSQRLSALLEVALCSGFPTQLVLFAVMYSLGMRLTTAADGPWSPAFVSTLSLLDTALVVGLVFFFLRASGEHPRDVLLGYRRVWKEVIAGIALLPLVFIVALLILALILTLAPQLHNVSHNPVEDMLQNRRDAVIFGIVAMIAGGVREEIQRGFILHRFSQYLGGGVLGVAVYSAVFGLGHLDQGRDASIAVATLGAIWGTIYLTRRSIIAPMVSHAGFNLAQLVKFLVMR